MRKHSKIEKAHLASALTQVCALQKQFGKTQADLETLVEGFSWVLAEHPMSVILDALRKYISTPGCNDIPAPSDLVKIIDPPNEPLSAAAYVSLKKRIAEGHYPYSDERAFLRAFEAQEYAKVRGGSPELKDAQAQIANHTRSLGYDE